MIQTDLEAAGLLFCYYFSVATVEALEADLAADAMTDVILPSLSS